MGGYLSTPVVADLEDYAAPVPTTIAAMLSNGKRIEGSNAGIIGLDTAAQASAAFELPGCNATFVPANAPPCGRPGTITARQPWIAQNEYNRRFFAQFPQLQTLFASPVFAGKIVCAGSAAAWPLSASSASWTPGDIDLFVLETDKGRLSAIIDTFVSTVASAFGVDRHEVFVNVRRGLVGVVVPLPASSSSSAAAIDQLVDNTTKPIKEVTDAVQAMDIADDDGRTKKTAATNEKFVKVQLILRPFASLGDLLHMFDLPSCAVAFDGTKTYLTPLAAYAHTFMLNVVQPAKAGLTYAHRMCKYFDRGFGLEFPDIKPLSFVSVVANNTDMVNGVKLATDLALFSSGWRGGAIVEGTLKDVSKRTYDSKYDVPDTMVQAVRNLGWGIDVMQQLLLDRLGNNAPPCLIGRLPICAKMPGGNVNLFDFLPATFSVKSFPENAQTQFNLWLPAGLASRANNVEFIRTKNGDGSETVTYKFLDGIAEPVTASEFYMFGAMVR